jgi:peptidyl-prolyl cis-trans isomerase D
MFDFVRKHNRIMQVLLFLLIVPSFVLFGVERYNASERGGPVVAKVDGQDILQSDWDAEHKRESDRLRQQVPNLDPKLFDTPQARYATLERMVRERVLAAAAAKANLRTSDERLARELQSNEVIASLRGPDGKLDMERYKQLLGAQGLSPQMFEEQVRSDLASRQLVLGIVGTSPATVAQAQVTLAAYFDRREVQVARFEPSAYASKVQPTPAELEAYHKQNPQQFQAPEQASIEYVVLDAESVRKGITVNEQDLKTYYEQNAAQLAGKEERRSSHILVAVSKSASAADKEAAKKKAEDLLAAARKAPQSFGDLAKKNSDDKASGANGGDLEYSARGGYAAKPLEDAVFGMKKGDVQLVETEFGWHVVMLTDVRTPKQRSFEEMRPELEAELRRQQAQRKFAETADSFSNAVYEAADGYKSVADRFKVEVRTAQNVQRVPQASAKGPLSNPKLLAALFSQDSIEKKRNTEAVETAPGQLVSARLVQYSPARTLPFDEVKDQVREKVVAAKAAELAKKEGAEKLAAWKAAPATATMPAPVQVSRADSGKLAPEVLEAALRADSGALPAFTGVDLGNDGYAVVKVIKQVPRDAPPADLQKQEAAQYARWWSQAEGAAYYSLLKDRFKAEIRVPKPSAAGTDTASR